MQIKDLGKVITGHTPPTSKREYYGDLYTFIKPTDIDEKSRYVTSVEEKLSQLGYEKFKKSILPPYTPCMVTIGSLGKKMCLTHEWSFTNQAINAVIVDNKYNKFYVYYLLKYLLPTVKLLSNGTASGRENVSKSSFESIEISLPDRREQDNVANILSAYDELIENNIRRIKILEEMAQRIYREWFVHFRFPGNENIDLVESELGLIPEGWAVKNLFEIAEVTYGYPFKSKLFTESIVGEPVIRIRDIRNNQTNTYTTELADAKYIVQNGDLLVGMDGDFHMAKWAGGKAYLNQRVVRFRPVDSLSSYYLFLSLQKPIAFFDATVVGTTVAHLSDKHLRSVNILVPDANITKRVKQVFDPIFEEEINLRIRNSNLHLTRDLLLPRLITGELDVKS